MTETTIIAIVAAVVASIPPTLAAVAALISSRNNATKADAVSAKVDVVHALANDNLSKATSALAVANETIKGLQMLNTSLAASKQVSPEPKPK